MIRKLSLYSVLAMIILQMTSINLFAQKRIRFAKGRSSATISVTIPAKSNRFFVVEARSGQFARVSVNNRRLRIFTDEAPKGETGSSSFETYTGDNEFGVYNPTNRRIRYRLTISIR